MECDLSSTLRSSQPLSDEHNQFFLYQILRGLKFVHSARVIHRDLKPRNLLVNSNCELKICDFGMAKLEIEAEGWVCPLTHYVCTRWYRAPEILCSWDSYSTAMDMWSVGVIFAEMVLRQALFPGRSTQHQLILLVNPDEAVLSKIPNEKCRDFILGQQRSGRLG